ncbi:GIY-YIG nuclease family protein [Maribacter sp. ANRC-HE7]|nr:GIY-YIG nuclease family protein [Maribacter aquimaris]MBD0777179.1 GIY-YIG nuclease family protein [Maribacter aquimaris]
MHFFYILHSKTINRYYIGETPDLTVRFEQHNQHHFKKNFTKAADDWTIALSKKCKSKQDAVYLEKFVKRMKSKKFIHKIIENPEILDDLIIQK